MIFIYDQSYLRSTYTDHTGVVPASRVAEDDNDHEHARDQLKDSAELEQTDGGGEADGQPHHDSQDGHHHSQPREHRPSSECR